MFVGHAEMVDPWLHGRLEHIPDSKVLSLVDAAALLGLEPLTLETLAPSRAYGFNLKHSSFWPRQTLAVPDHI